MSDRPILFSGSMVRALLDGRKTQTRRVLKDTGFDWVFGANTTFTGWQPERVHGIRWCLKSSAVGAYFNVSYAPRDRLWVREHWKVDSQLDHIPPRTLSSHEPRLYLADGTMFEPTCMMIKPGKHRQAMHMPRWASRLTLTVTDVRVQRMQEISSDDCEAEGWPGATICGMQRAEWFRNLWDSLNDARGYGWNANPWAVAYTFKVERRNIDQ